MLADRPRLVGEDDPVPLVGGRWARAVNLDCAATTPAMQPVADLVQEILPLYASVHRGAGWRSRVCSEMFEHAREVVARFVGARSDDVVVWTANTTGAMNSLSEALPDDAEVLAFDSEHHANLLPWQRRSLRLLPTPRCSSQALSVLEQALRRSTPPCLVAVTAASNVTGAIWPVAEITALAHQYGARVVVDAAQLAPHAPVDLGGWDADWVALSGHKTYAPFGAGALVGRRDWLEQRAPHVRGGGAVRFVAGTDVLWSSAPTRQEAGSPNLVGVAALAAACLELGRLGMTEVFAHEQRLLGYLLDRIDRIDGMTRYPQWDDAPHIGVVTFNLAGLPHSLVAAVLSAEHGVAVRDGCFCAHPLMLRLLQVPDATVRRLRQAMAAGVPVDLPGAVRISTGLATGFADIDVALDALADLAASGPRARYRRSGPGGHYSPDPDDRPLPDLIGRLTPPVAPALAAAGGAGAAAVPSVPSSRRGRRA